MSLLITIEGYPASGKSVFARSLSEALNVPCFIKDTFKSAICSGIPIYNREESKKFSAVTFDAIMYAAERLIERSCPVIIEGNFAPFGVKALDEAGEIRKLADKYGCKTLTFKFFGDTGVLHRRFNEREKTPERGQANLMFSELSFEVFDNICHSLDGFDIGGKSVKIDTTDFDKVEYKTYIDIARDELNKICKA